MLRVRGLELVSFLHACAMNFMVVSNPMDHGTSMPPHQSSMLCIMACHGSS